MTLRVDDVAGADGGRAAGDAVDGEVVLSGAPVALEALGRDAGADGAAEGHALGKAGVVAVQQRRRVGVQGVDLQETGAGHGQAPCVRVCYSSWEFDWLELRSAR